MKQYIFVALIALLLVLCVSCSSVTETAGASDTEVGTAEATETEGTEATDTETAETTDTEASDTENTGKEAALYTYSPYVLPYRIKEEMGEEYALYKSLISAYLSHGDTAEGFSSEEQFVRVWGVALEYYYPLTKIASTYRDSDTPYVYKDGCVTLFYKEDKTACDGYIKAFESEINGILALIDEGDTEIEAARKLFEYVVNDMEYDGELNGGSMYDIVVTEARGMCGAYAKYLCLLLDQVGIRCEQVSAEPNEAGVYHAWVAAELTGNWYHIDPTFQEDVPSDVFDYFGMSDSERRRTLNPEWYSSLAMGDDPSSVAELDTEFTAGLKYKTNEKAPSPECPFEL